MTAVRDALIARLERETKADDAWPALVLAALDGEAALEALISGAASAAPAKGRKPTTKPAKAGAAPQPAYLRSVTVEGFRGIGPPATLEIAAGPGLTLVVGRNGSGKSSFAEALELLLTGNTYRWADRSKVWRDGWRNLHHGQAAIAAEFALEGERGPCTITTAWEDEADLEAAAGSVQVHGKPRTSLQALGWDEALVSHRPFLSYNELGTLLDAAPSEFYDALAGILGLEELNEIQGRLQQARTAREKTHKAAADARKEFLPLLDQIDDERARRASAALHKDDWGLDEAEATAASDTADDAGALQLLRSLAALAAPDPQAVAAAVDGLRTAAGRLKQASQAVAARSRDLADLLDHALRFHQAHGDGDCPVCGKPAALNPKWRGEQTKCAAELHGLARDVTAAHEQVKAALRQAQLLPAPRVDVVRRAATVGLTADRLLGELERWASVLGASDPEAVAAQIEATAGPLRNAADALRQAAAAELQSREDAWRPVARELRGWIDTAREALAGKASVPDLKKAEDWVKRTMAATRDERFAPIAERSIAIWEQLRQRSSVTLGRIDLKGSGRARHVELVVQVDGKDGAALGVMSQGELSALALSLFIPRATLPESPFRFIVIDDPLQSMDPARVDGLARVLEAAARDRQVVVFTHDDRLAEALRRLRIAASVIEVTRREQSVVHLLSSKDPIERYIEDAVALAYTDNLPAEAARRVIPGLCRLALEAACNEAVRRRRIGRGEPHAEVEKLLEKADKLSRLVALALFDDAGRGADVLPRLNKERREHADVFRWCNEGAHEGAVGPITDRVHDTTRLAQWLKNLR